MNKADDPVTFTGVTPVVAVPEDASDQSLTREQLPLRASSPRMM